MRMRVRLAGNPRRRHHAHTVHPMLPELEQRAVEGEAGARRRQQKPKHASLRSCTACFLPTRRRRAPAMSLETIISSALTRPDEDRNALVLMGGGARTAYQAGVLHALSTMLSLQG